MNEVKSKLEENWEYVSYDLSYREFKAQVNVYFKNKKYVLKFTIEVGRHDDCPIEH